LVKNSKLLCRTTAVFRMSVYDECMVFGIIALCCQMFHKWKAEVDEKLKEEKKKKLRQERRVEESKKEDKTHQRKDARCAYESWYEF